MIGTARRRTTSALLVLAVLLGLLGWGAALAHPDPEQSSQQAMAASPLHAGQLVVRAKDAGLRALAERGRRQGPGSPSVPVAVVAAALMWAGLTLRGGAWRPGRAAGSRCWPRRAWSRAPPRHLQPA